MIRFTPWLVVLVAWFAAVVVTGGCSGTTLGTSPAETTTSPSTHPVDAAAFIENALLLFAALAFICGFGLYRSARGGAGATVESQWGGFGGGVGGWRVSSGTLFLLGTIACASILSLIVMRGLDMAASSNSASVASATRPAPPATIINNNYYLATTSAPAQPWKPTPSAPVGDAGSAVKQAQPATLPTQPAATAPAGG